MDLPDSVDVVIWGSGIAGSRLAASLAKAGHTVIVIPRGPASYPELPGFGVMGQTSSKRADIERNLLDEAANHGAHVLHAESIVGFLPELGPVQSVTLVGRSIQTRCMVFSDGSDPRIGRSRGLLPDWEPWQLVHFAYQMVEAPVDLAVIDGSRAGRSWRGYRIPTAAGTMIGVGWYLQHEVDSAIHVTELLQDVVRRFGVETPLSGQPAVEVVPYEPRHFASKLAVDNIFAVGDLTGIANPMSLRRTAISLKMGDTASQLIQDWLAGERSIKFDRKRISAAFREFVRSSIQDDEGPPMPDVPRSRSETRGVGKLIRQFIDRS
jgi:flavin-dependent dehydrogenase